MNVPRQKVSPFLQLAGLLALDVAVFVLQKIASNHAQGATSDEEYVRRLLLHPWLWIALAIGPIQLWTWTRILAKMDLSYAYPVTALSYPMTMAVAVLFLGEQLPWQVWVGALLITGGVWTMGTSHSTPKSTEVPV